jgi:hypothetical protein
MGTLHVKSEKKRRDVVFYATRMNHLDDVVCMMVFFIIGVFAAFFGIIALVLHHI